MNKLHHTQHIFVFVQFGALCPKPWHLKHGSFEGVFLNSCTICTLKFMHISWHTSPPEISASACFGSSLFILMNDNSFPDLLISYVQPRHGLFC